MSDKKANKPEEMKFEKAIGELEKIVEFLEGDDVPLDEALQRYEEGIRLSRHLSHMLTQAEKKIEILTRTLEGEFKAEPFGGEEGAAKPRKKSPAVSSGDESGEAETLF